MRKLKKFRKHSTRIGAFKDFYIWTQDHVKSYLGKYNAYIQVLKVYKLENSACCMIMLKKKFL